MKKQLTWLLAGALALSIAAAAPQAAKAAEIPEVKAGEWYFEELYVNKGWRTRPVAPKGGAKYQITSVPNHPLDNYGSAAVLAFEAGDGAFDNIAHPEETTIEILHFWLSERMSVTAYDKENKIVHFDRLPRQKLIDSHDSAYAKYRIINVREAFCEAGEWYLDKREGKLYYIPLPGETADNILSGKIDINPSFISGFDPCAYCPYGAVCQNNH